MQKSYFHGQRFAGFGQDFAGFSFSGWEIWNFCTKFRHKFIDYQFVPEQKEYTFKNIGFGGHR